MPDHLPSLYKTIPYLQPLEFIRNSSRQDYREVVCGCKLLWEPHEVKPFDSTDRLALGFLSKGLLDIWVSQVLVFTISPNMLVIGIYILAGRTLH